ncbi:chromate transporter [Sedimentibacter acidaminivorans]|uniref:Chromate transporter n=1 Tax=Sedimentibacter acidaminivorans TaxID=913099 RepID=A0ABS4G9F3_9FIRM|nr:chromate efflux transporter [Sedimentibacter acidaminivorans]MBP1924323.1 chromate transporter [Sedimentibacter acidaminivorans]
MNKIKWRSFLKDAFICSLGAYGGPEAHFGVFMDQLVTKKEYLTEEELVELVALCSILPGPTSTQTLVAIGYKTGGPLLAFFTMIVWSLPVLVLMTVLSFVYQIFAAFNISSNVLRYIGPMAVGFIVVAAFRITKKVVTNWMTGALMLSAAFVTYFFHLPWVFPLLLVLGGTVSIVASGENNLWNKVKVNPPWRYLFVFGAFAIGSLVLTAIFGNRLLTLFESFYRYGYLVFGGGQVVVPVMYSELVDVRAFMTHEEFLTGYGLVQGLPGPMFSFSAYAGGMSYRDGGVLFQIIAAFIGGVGIFLPGLLLIYFVYPVWENLKQIKAIKVSLKGINAVAGGLIAVAAIILMQKSGFSIDNLIVTAITTILLFTKKISAPLIVVLTLVLGLIL